MKNLPVHWYEGLFLRPHHFQAAERFQAEQSSTSHQWDFPYGYGLHALTFSHDALANNKFEVQRLQARLRDGTLVEFDFENEPDRVDLKAASAEQAKSIGGLSEAFDVENTIRVYVGVPRLRAGQSNIDTDGSTGVSSRYAEVRLNTDDENRDANLQEIQYRQLNAKILLSNARSFRLRTTADRTAQASQRSGSISVTRYELHTAASFDRCLASLGRDIIRGIYDIIGQKIEVLGQQILNRGVGRETREPGDAERITMLERLNEAYGVLSVLAFAKGVHPSQAYLELCRILGSLAIFLPERHIAQYPPYEHEDNARIFTWVKVQIERIINSVRDFQFEQRYFEGVGMGMQVSLEPRWFNSDWEWYVGVAKGDLSTTECRDLLFPRATRLEVW